MVKSFKADMTVGKEVPVEYVPPNWSWATVEHGDQLAAQIEQGEYQHEIIKTAMLHIEDVGVGLNDTEKIFGQ
jgi:hypothetical protein